MEIGQAVLVNTGHAILDGVVESFDQYGVTVAFNGFTLPHSRLDVYELSEIDKLEETIEREAFCKKELLAHFRGTLCAGR